MPPLSRAEPPPSRTERTIEALIGIALYLALLCHTAVLMLNDGPDNAIKISSRNYLQHYMNPLIAQDWSFFAPLPEDRNESYLMRCEDSKGQWTPWVNVSRYVGDKIKADRLSNFDLLDTGLHSDILSAGSLDVVGLKRRGENAYSYASVKDLARTGFSLLRSEYPQRSFTRLESGILIQIFPRFTRRYDSDNSDKRSFRFFGAETAPRDVADIAW